MLESGNTPVIQTILVRLVLPSLLIHTFCGTDAPHAPVLTKARVMLAPQLEGLTDNKLTAVLEHCSSWICLSWKKNEYHACLGCQIGKQ